MDRWHSSKLIVSMAWQVIFTFAFFATDKITPDLYEGLTYLCLGGFLLSRVAEKSKFVKGQD